MVEVIVVAPADSEWTVTSPSADEIHRFQNGQLAEAKASQIGVEFSAAGRHAEIRIFLRDGTLAGKFLCTPSWR